MKILVIVGTTRRNRLSEKPARWIFEEAKKIADFEVELVDLRDYPLPFYDEEMSPRMIKDQYEKEEVKKWAKKIGEGDGYIIVTAEYNHSFPAVLKNALDYIYYEWNGKPVGFVSYGTVGGVRAVEQLRLVTLELDMKPIHAAIHIPVQIMKAIREQKEFAPDVFAELDGQKKLFFEQLAIWTKGLKAIRDQDKI